MGSMIWPKSKNLRMASSVFMRLMGLLDRLLDVSSTRRKSSRADLPRPKKKLSTRYSLIVPCYNVEKYLDDFFHSVFSQSVDPECLEIIAVDDGSTDGTAQRIADWGERFPGRIQYIFQHNQRQAAARNTGLALATGEWVSFPDPDDFFSTNYVEKVDEELARARSRPLSMVSCNLMFFKEAKGKKHDSHPLRYRFREEPYNFAGRRSAGSHAAFRQHGLVSTGSH